MKKSLLVIGCWLLVGCTNAKSPSDIARDACKVAMTIDPLTSQLVPSWGKTVDEVAAAICLLPNIIQLFETLPPANAKQQATASLKRMASAVRPE